MVSLFYLQKSGYQIPVKSRRIVFHNSFEVRSKLQNGILENVVKSILFSNTVDSRTFFLEKSLNKYFNELRSLASLKTFRMGPMVDS